MCCALHFLFLLFLYCDIHVRNKDIIIIIIIIIIIVKSRLEPYFSRGMENQYSGFARRLTYASMGHVRETGRPRSRPTFRQR